MLEHEIECLREQGFTDILITVSHLGNIIMDYFGDGAEFGVNISYYFEKEPLGNAGALFKVKDQLTDDFLLLNADAMFDIDFNRFVDYHYSHGGIATLFTHPNSHPYDSGVIVADDNHRVLNWLSTIVHSHHRMAALYAELICDKSIVKIANAHNTFHDKKTLTRLAYRNTKLIAVGEMVKKNLVEYYEIPSEQVTVIHNAIKPFEDKITIDSTIEKLHQDGYFVVGNVGRLSEQKGMEYFIDAIPAVLKQHSKTKFLIIGKGELEEELKKRVADLKVEDAVIFMGYRSDIQNLMSQLDLEVLSSLWEGFPLIPIEAFSVGRTVVATGVDGTLEIVQNEENGLMIEPRKPDQIAEAISRFIEDKNLKDKCEYGAKKSYEKEYSFDKFAEAHRDYYRRLLEKS